MRHKLKIEHDKWYTPINTSKRLIEKTIELIGIDNISEIIEPSAGNGSFSNILFDNYKNYKNVLAYDLVPEESRIIKQDFMELPLEYKKNRLFIGNPPFGRGTLVKKFILKSMNNSDYIGYILPTSYYNCDYYWNKEDHFKCIYKEIINDFGSTAPCCYILWKKIEKDDNKIIKFINEYEIDDKCIMKSKKINKRDNYNNYKFTNLCFILGQERTLTLLKDENHYVTIGINTNSQDLDTYIKNILDNGYLRSLSIIKHYTINRFSLLNLLYKACEGKEFKIGDK